MKKESAKTSEYSVEKEFNGKTVRLSLPKYDKKKSGFLEDALMRINKPELWELLKPLHNLLKNAKLEYTENSDPALCRLMTMMADPGLCAKLHKEDYAKLYIAFTSDLSNISNLAEVSPTLRMIWDMIIRWPSLTSYSLEALLGRPIVLRHSYGWNAVEFIESDLFPLNRIYYESAYYSYSFQDSYSLSLAPEVRRILAIPLLGPESVEPEVVKDLPEEEGLKRMNFEDVVSSDLLFLSGLGMTGSPLSESRGTLPAARLKSIKNQLGTREFPYMGMEYALDRVELIASAYFLMAERVRKPEKLSEAGAFCKEVVEKMAGALTGTMFEMFLPAFKGFSKVWAERSSAATVAKITENLLLPAAEGWMSLSNLSLRYLCGTVCSGEVSYISLFSYSLRRKSTLKSKSDPKAKPDILAYREITFAFVLHWIEFLCAIGMVEIAYTDNKEDDEKDILEGLRYVRLTPLGRYALGIDRKYVGTAAKNRYEIDYDDANRILTIVGESCPYAIFLRSISIPISEKRFRITPESLLKGCERAPELEERISGLEQIIDIEKYPNLKKITEEAMERTKCVDKLHESYEICRVNRRLPDFVRLLMTNKTIRENCIMAENSVILVQKEFLLDFKRICQRAGYLPDL